MRGLWGFAILLLATFCQAELSVFERTRVRTFGTGVSSAPLTNEEALIFDYNVSQHAHNGGVMTHFWTTGGTGIDETIFRYYVDGEETASIAFTPAMACGVGFDDEQAPWGTKYIGKGARQGGWFHNIRVPFARSIRITAQLPHGLAPTTYYAIVRGAENIPIRIGGEKIPTRSRLRLAKIDRISVNPLQFVPLLDVPSGRGAVLFSTLAVESGNLNFLEGCFHLYTPHAMPFPGVVLSTGTEDYYDSAYYFDSGEFRDPVSGFTHMSSKNGTISWSAYRFHEQDPVVFDDGVRFEWRNGDEVDPSTGKKCFTQSGGRAVGSPTKSIVSSYVWYYSW